MTSVLRTILVAGAAVAALSFTAACHKKTDAAASDAAASEAAASDAAAASDTAAAASDAAMAPASK